MNSKWGLNASKFINERSYKTLNGCWLWSGYLNKDGYALINNYKCAKQYKVNVAHQLSYILKYGDFDRSKRICHTCDTRSCVNPKHLYLGTMQTNMNDKMLRNRHQCPKGSNQWKSKLNEIDIIIIKAMLRNKYKGIDLANYYQVSTATISLIKNNQTWGTVCELS